MKEKIIFYLNFAKTKLDHKCVIHEKAREEIEEIITKIKETKDEYKQ